MAQVVHPSLHPFKVNTDAALYTQTPSNISDFLSHTESTARRAIAIVLRASGPLMKGGYYSVVVYYEIHQR